MNGIVDISAGRAIVAALQTVCIFMVVSCSTGPDYKSPNMYLGEDWSDVGQVDTEVVQTDWWTSFDDPVLSELVRAAMDQNLSIAEAQLRVVEARAVRSAAQGGFWPNLSGSASKARLRNSVSVPGIASIDPSFTYQTVYDVGLDSSWELDIFGQTRRSVESADAQYHAQIERARDAAITVAAETALAYFEMRGAQLQLAAEWASYEAAQHNHRLIEKRFGVGRASLADLHRADADVKSIHARLPRLEAERDGAARRLSLVLGELPERQSDLARTQRAFPKLSSVPIGTRAELIRRRPDVRAAERSLAAATANIGVAKGELFPSLTLVSSIGFSSASFASLSDSVSRTWSVLPLIQWRLFEGGRLTAELEAARARAEQAAVNYEATVLGAISEVEQSLIRYQKSLETVDRQAAAVTATEAGLDLVDKQYRAGGVSLLVLLDAQRQVNNARTRLARNQTSAALELVLLYKALAGGWS